MHELNKFSNHFLEMGLTFNTVAARSRATKQSHTNGWLVGIKRRDCFAMLATTTLL